MQKVSFGAIVAVVAAMLVHLVGERQGWASALSDAVGDEGSTLAMIAAQVAAAAGAFGAAAGPDGCEYAACKVGEITGKKPKAKTAKQIAAEEREQSESLARASAAEALRRGDRDAYARAFDLLHNETAPKKKGGQ